MPSQKICPSPAPHFMPPMPRTLPTLARGIPIISASIRKNPAAQAYYDSIAQLYAGWGVDFLKVDCIASHPYKGEEIRMLSLALQKTGRPIVLSLSPGAAPIEKIDELRQYSQMWRISDDVWDIWHSDVDYPQGLGNQFPRAAQWAALSRARPLARCRHAPARPSRPCSRLGRSSRHAPHPRRAAHAPHSLVHVPLAADDGRRSPLRRCLDHILANESRSHRRRSALHRKSRANLDRQRSRLASQARIRPRRVHSRLQPRRNNAILPLRMERSRFAAGRNIYCAICGNKKISARPIPSPSHSRPTHQFSTPSQKIIKNKFLHSRLRLARSTGDAG